MRARNSLTAKWEYYFPGDTVEYLGKCTGIVQPDGRVDFGEGDWTYELKSHAYKFRLIRRPFKNRVKRLFV